MDREIEISGNEALEAAVESVAQGDSVVLTRHGEPVAAVVARAGRAVLAASQASDDHVKHIKEMRKGQRLGPGITLKDLINEGRR